MSGLFGKGSGLDPLGLTTSKIADPLGINRKVNDTVDKIDPLTDWRRKNISKLDPLAITDDSAAAKGLERSQMTDEQKSVARQQLLG